jgi:hypothetical protein
MRLSGWTEWQVFELPLLLAQQGRLALSPGV